MSYQEALEAAGAQVLAFAEFDSYQGDWLARLPGGYVSGSYGSCSGCDAFEGEFGHWSGRCSEHDYEPNPPADCEACAAGKAVYSKRLTAFGQSYLDDLTDAASLRERFTKQAEWDRDATEIVAWLDAQEVAS